LDAAKASKPEAGKGSKQEAAKASKPEAAKTEAVKPSKEAAKLPKQDAKPSKEVAKPSKEVAKPSKEAAKASKQDAPTASKRESAKPSKQETAKPSKQETPKPSKQGRAANAGGGAAKKQKVAAKGEKAAPKVEAKPGAEKRASAAKPASNAKPGNGSRPGAGSKTRAGAKPGNAAKATTKGSSAATKGSSSAKAETGKPLDPERLLRFLAGNRGKKLPLQAIVAHAGGTPETVRATLQPLVRAKQIVRRGADVYEAARLRRVENFWMPSFAALRARASSFSAALLGFSFCRSAPLLAPCCVPMVPSMPQGRSPLAYEVWLTAEDTALWGRDAGRGLLAEIRQLAQRLAAEVGCAVAIRAADGRRLEEWPPAER
jgi:hypothetical protein